MRFRIGDTIKPYGRLIAIAFITGERYYFFKNKCGIAMMPAVMFGRAAT